MMDYFRTDVQDKANVWDDLYHHKHLSANVRLKLWSYNIRLSQRLRLCSVILSQTLVCQELRGIPEAIPYSLHIVHVCVVHTYTNVCAQMLVWFKNEIPNVLFNRTLCAVRWTLQTVVHKIWCGIRNKSQTLISYRMCVLYIGISDEIICKTVCNALITKQLN